MNFVTVNGINIFTFVNKNDLVVYVNNVKQILIAINAEKIVNSNSELKNLINNNIGYADGVGAVMALRKKGIKHVEKIAGCELWLDIIKQYKDEKTFYLIGSTKDVISSTVEKMRLDFPGVKIVNYHDGFLDNQAIEDIKSELKNKKPDIVFVGMGTPKQEFLMKDLLSVHPALYQGLGGSFDVYTNTVKRAPKFFIRNGVEWLYRLLKQPLRIKRQIKLLKFVYLLLFDKL
jgi:UDP-N-acetyl-D-mannosaminouronate:lipid I N-acetyl-D-mannosaminouronosyltransferase